MADRALINEVVEHVLQDPRLTYQRVDPWVRNACRRMRSGKFDHQLFVGGLQRNLVPEALKDYGIDSVKYVAKEDRAAIARGLATKIEAKARAASKKGACGRYESPTAQEHMRRYGISSRA